MKEVFTYSSYQEYITDYFEYTKKIDRRFSYAVFAEQIGFASRTFMHKVIHGQKKLAKNAISKVAGAMSLGKKETDYFRNLVLFNDAKTLTEKNYYYKRMNTAHVSNVAAKLRKEQYSYFYNWYNAALRELVTFVDFKEDYNYLSSFLEPVITPKKVKDSVALLLKLGLIKKKGKKYIQTSAKIKAGKEIEALAIQNFQRDNMKLASSAIERFKKECRDLSTVTFGINKQGFTEIKKEFSAFRKIIIDIVARHADPDRVYQANFQLFPLSYIPKDGRQKRLK